MSDYAHRDGRCQCQDTAESAWIAGFTRLVLSGWSPEELESLSA